jgi:hypothetical protein
MGTKLLYYFFKKSIVNGVTLLVGASNELAVTLTPMRLPGITTLSDRRRQERKREPYFHYTCMLSRAQCIMCMHAYVRMCKCTASASQIGAAQLCRRHTVRDEVVQCAQHIALRSMMLVSRHQPPRLNVYYFELTGVHFFSYGVPRFSSPASGEWHLTVQCFSTSRVVSNLGQIQRDQGSAQSEFEAHSPLFAELPNGFTCLHRTAMTSHDMT